MNGNQANSSKWNKVMIAVALLIAAAGIATRLIESDKLVLADDPPAQATFRSPAEAGSALAQAMNSGDAAELKKVVGDDAAALLTTADAASDKEAMRRFSAKYAQMNRWLDMSDGSRVLYIGADNFAFPVPLAKNTAGSWYFDAVAGAQEIRARDIGRNELVTIDALGAIASAEEIYREYSPSREFAQRIISTPGKQDGLYWPASDTVGISPIGYLDDFGKSALAADSPDQPFVVDGYTVRILTAQGTNAPGGAKSYLVDGKMIHGFAIFATPAKYGETGIMSFLVSRKAVIYERDLGPDTAKIAASVQEYNPDEQWSRLE